MVLTYRTVPSKPHMLLFKKRSKPVHLCYSRGEPLAQFKKNGMGSIYYPDGKVAVLRQRGRKCNRFIIFNPSKLNSSIVKMIEPARGRSEVRAPHRDRSEDRLPSQGRKQRAHSKGKSEVQAHSEGKSIVQAHSESKSELRAHSESKSEVRPHSESKSELRAHSKVKSEVRPQSKGKSKVRANSKGKSKVRANSKGKSKSRANSKGKSKSRANSKGKGKVRSRSKSSNEDKSEAGSPAIKASLDANLHESHTKVVKKKRRSSPSRGRLPGAGICAMFDSWGNGVIYDEAGKIRLNFTQREGILLDGPNGLPVKWKWPVKFTKGESVENLGTQETFDEEEKAFDDRDSDDDEEKKPVPEEGNTELNGKKVKGKKGNSKGKITEKKSKGKMSSSELKMPQGKASKSKKKSGKSRSESKSSKNSSKKAKKTESNKNVNKSKSSQNSSKKGKKKKAGGGVKDTDSKGTSKTGKQKKRKSQVGGGDDERSRMEPDGTEVWPDIPEETPSQHLSEKVSDGRGDELEKVHSVVNMAKENYKQELAEIHALREKYYLPGIAPLKPITLKVNDYVSFRILDQSNISLVFHAQHKMIRLELGFVVDPSEKIKVNKVDPVKWYEGHGVPNQIELFAKRSMTKYKDLLNRQREMAAKKQAERRQNEKRFGGPYLK